MAALADVRQANSSARRNKTTSLAHVGATTWLVAA